MNATRHFGCIRWRPSRAFTLIEILVATTILSLMVLVLAQLTDLSSRSMNDGMRRADNFTKARAALDLFATDIALGVFREDLGAFRTNVVGDYTPAFFTRRPGIGGDRALSLIAYRTVPAQARLERANRTILWTDASPIGFGTPNALPRFTALTSTDYQEIATGIIAWQLYFIDSDGNYRDKYEPTYSQTPAGLPYLLGVVRPTCKAVGVALASIDEANLKILNASGKLGDLQNELPAQTNQDQTYQAFWSKTLRSSSIIGSLPVPVRSSLRIFERLITLPLT
jgi:prepilin-type N-terminal cleavage/methylation domain-containing protein